MRAFLRNYNEHPNRDVIREGRLARIADGVLHEVTDPLPLFQKLISDETAQFVACGEPADREHELDGQPSEYIDFPLGAGLVVLSFVIPRGTTEQWTAPRNELEEAIQDHTVLAIISRSDTENVQEVERIREANQAKLDAYVVILGKEEAFRYEVAFEVEDVDGEAVELATPRMNLGHFHEDTSLEELLTE